MPRARNGEYDLRIDLEDAAASGEESQVMWGALIIEDNKGQTLKLYVYGECGC